METKKGTKPKITKSSSKGHEKSGITDTDIRSRAYEIYLERDPGEGTPEDDWCRAEEELYSDPGF